MITKYTIADHEVVELEELKYQYSTSLASLDRVVRSVARINGCSLDVAVDFLNSNSTVRHYLDRRGIEIAPDEPDIIPGSRIDWELCGITIAICASALGVLGWCWWEWMK